MVKPIDLLFGETSPTHESVLEKATFGDGSPGPLLGNIARLIQTIGKSMPTTSAYFALPQARLVELNAALDDPLPHDLKRPQLRSFPSLTGLFALLRNIGLAVGESKPKRVLLIDPTMLERWQRLNPTEQYFALLACWLYEATLGCLGERHGQRAHWAK